MNISVCSINALQDYEQLGLMTGETPVNEPDVIEFSKKNCFYLDGVKFEIRAKVAKSNFKGNIEIKRDDMAFLSSLMTIDEVFTLAIRVSSEYWIHLTIST